MAESFGFHVLVRRAPPSRLLSPAIRSLAYRLCICLPQTTHIYIYIVRLNTLKHSLEFLNASEHMTTGSIPNLFHVTGAGSWRGGGGGGGGGGVLRPKYQWTSCA